jgi:hypothetical protein
MMRIEKAVITRRSPLIGPLRLFAVFRARFAVAEPARLPSLFGIPLGMIFRRPMNNTIRNTSLLLGLLGASLLPAMAAQPSADQLLREMSSTLAAAKTFSFSATREIDAGLLGAIELPGKASIDALIQRPDKFAIRSVTKKGERQFVANGRTITLYESEPNFYTVAPMPRSLDALVDLLDEKYGFTPPLADYAVSDPYKELRGQADSLTYLGREKVGGGFLGLGGVSCDRIMLKGKRADAELWIGVRDHLPHQLVVTFHRLPEHPKLVVKFRSWNLAAHATAADFTFTPPKGAAQIEMVTVSKMQQIVPTR